MKNRYEKKRLWIVGALPPDQSDKGQLWLYKNAGFNLLDMTEDNVKACSKAYFDCLKYAEEVGLAVHVKEHHDFPNYWSKNFSHVNLNDYSSVVGFFITDEPNKDALYEIAKEYLPFYKEKYEQTGMNFVINTYCGETEHFMGPASDYLDLMMELIYNKLDTPNKYLSIDEYPLRRNMHGKPYLDEREWIPYTALTAKKCRENGVRFGACMQSFGGEWCDCRMPSSVEELRFMAYIYLAFGAELLYYFVYRTGHEWGFMGMISEQGVPNALYYHTKTLNEELLSFEEEYLSYAWAGALAIDGEKRETPSEPLQKTREFLGYEDKELVVVKAEKDLIVGCFEKEGGHAYLLISYGEPFYDEGNEIELTFQTAKKFSLRRNGVEEIVESKDGKLTLTTAKGEGFYIQTM